ncbi:MAG: CDP-diacylglycerol--glycerol-3-phosphate 3-phosphatidyltransferase [Firmicutes bacterium]|nr:CDP-diacylglycerol--glycerol-3-phosphate 3-phosphatidyltransferase [Bacillota bacterium]MBR3374964.1 CDP-diacylglycerol--glycerol-3-phosphate 3-phosphatidyltransferase [Bacillota bacterium]MBR4023939.1 CDP-diacylglycerol--glycerol-3-phosphate 3-phosphatidyltransferase [Bacillota bacterium]MBR6224282.1 CDP-diacylglycerol--glycerol-3-phosphate 3-phosphatidyltransferase [Bacillota bacterium]MBR6956053.1 CDP-diacylglycerol--glycerol-3-phosphate 3-phosphatidyltransferase [Bacillota bacterium]
MNLPNKLTIARIIAVPFFIAAYYLEWHLVAFLIFIAASFTDMLDGKIARKYNLVTNFGKIMDPLADKVLVYSAFCLMVPDPVPGWMLIIILAREFLVAGVRTVAASEGIVIAAALSGKIKTVLQMVAVCMLLIAPVINTSWFLILGKIVLWAALVMTVISGVQYVVDNKQVFSK